MINLSTVFSFFQTEENPAPVAQVPVTPAFYGHDLETWDMIYDVTDSIFERLTQEALESETGFATGYFQTICGGWLRISAVALDAGSFIGVMYMVGKRKVLLSQNKAFNKAAIRMAQ